MNKSQITIEELKKSLITFNLEKITNEIIMFINNVVNSSGSGGVVVGLSGGIDSSVTVTLCVKALGKDKVLGVLLPLNFTPSQDMDDARELAKMLGIKTKTVNIQKITDLFFNQLNTKLVQKIPMMNVRARIRMVLLYYFANLYNYLVAGTGDKSENLIGFFTKYGDGAADFFVINHLYKTQVRLLGEYLGVPRNIINKTSSPQLYPGHKATDEIPIDYDILDLILMGLFDKNMDVDKVSNIIKVPKAIVKEILVRFHRSKHKRTLPLVVETLMF